MLNHLSFYLFLAYGLTPFWTNLATRKHVSYKRFSLQVRPAITVKPKKNSVKQKFIEEWPEYTVKILWMTVQGVSGVRNLNIGEWMLMIKRAKDRSLSLKETSLNELIEQFETIEDSSQVNCLINSMKFQDQPYILLHYPFWIVLMPMAENFWKKWW